MDIRDTDLPNLAFTMVKWFCIVDGCRGHAKVRDYGIGGYYYWPVKVIRKKDGWRGGWFNNSHVYLCCKHWEPVMNLIIDPPDTSDENRMSKFVKAKK